MVDSKTGALGTCIVVLESSKPITLVVYGSERDAYPAITASYRKVQNQIVMSGKNLAGRGLVIVGRDEFKEWAQKVLDLAKPAVRP